MAKIQTVNAKEISKEVVGDLEIECKEALKGITARLPVSMVAKLMQLKKDLKAQGHNVTLSDLIRSALQKVFVDC